MARISTSRVPICTTAKTRPRTSSATSPPSSVVPARNAMPAPAPTRIAPRMAIDRWMAKASTSTEALASTMLMPNQRRRDMSRTIIGPRPMPSARPTKIAPKSSVEGGVTGAERVGEELGRADHDAAAGERAEDAQHQAADERGLADVLPALGELPEHALLGALRLGALGLADLLDPERHHERGGQPGEGVEPERELGRLGPVGQVAADRAAHAAGPARPARRPRPPA